MMGKLAGVVGRIREAEEGPTGLNAFLALAGNGVESGDADPSRRREPAGDAHRRANDSGGQGALTDVPVALKDNIVTSDLPTTCGSRILDGYVSPFDATVVRKLRAAGALIVGKTNLDEFGMGSSTENSAYGPTLNPVDPSRVPGGSSGGSAAAVAAGYVDMALGSDTGGSVRQPAALCGVVGLKPTYGRVSRYGLVAFASSLDQIGTFGRTVAQAADLLEVVAGHDARDATSADAPVPAFGAAARGGVEGLVVGVPEEFFPDSLAPEMRARTNAALTGLAARGAEIRSVSLPSSDLAIPCYYVIAPAEASSNLSRFEGVRYGRRVPAQDMDGMIRATRGEGFGPEVKRRIMLGTYALSSGYYDRYYGAAQRTRHRIRADLSRVFDSGVDVLFTPTTPAPAFPLGDRVADPLAMYLSDVFTVTANLAGVPAMSVPIGEVDGLPVGGQVMARWWDEETMIRVGAALEVGS